MVNYRDYMPRSTSRMRENIEWSITYTYNSNDTAHPRVLLIGDSICNGYQTKVREKLADTANVTFWASSKCVTDPQYFREVSGGEAGADALHAAWRSRKGRGIPRAEYLHTGAGGCGGASGHRPVCGSSGA